MRSKYKKLIIQLSCRLQSYVLPESSLSEERKRELTKRERDGWKRERTKIEKEMDTRRKKSDGTV